MEFIDRVILEAKKKGKAVNPWAVCTKSVGDKIGTTERSEWTKAQKERYERCVKDVKKKSPIKEDYINEYGGYDDPSMFATHAGGYMGTIKHHYNTIVSSLNELNDLSPEVLDDQLRVALETFLTKMEGSVRNLGKEAIEAEKRHLGSLRGGRPSPRDFDEE